MQSYFFTQLLRYLLIVSVPAIILWQMFVTEQVLEETVGFYLVTLLVTSVTIAIVVRFRLQPLLLPLLLLVGVSAVGSYFELLSHSAEWDRLLLVAYAGLSAFMFAWRLPLEADTKTHNIDGLLELHEVMVAAIVFMYWEMFREFETNFVSLAILIVAGYSALRVTSASADFLYRIKLISRPVAIAIMWLPIFTIVVTLSLFVGYQFVV